MKHTEFMLVLILMMSTLRNMSNYKADRDSVSSLLLLIVLLHWI